MRPLPLALLLCALTATAPAHAIDRSRVTDPRPLMFAALDAPTGTAYGILVGESADAIARRFQSASPIYIDVTTLRRYRQAGCSRLNVTIWQEGVILPGAAAPKKQAIDIGINYCRDGLPPKSLL
ncbi:hypothetical protein [Noviherbaspirillum sedimenti]|nr:hypothetical protein [Noviherbaspirillum sedimenti]